MFDPGSMDLEGLMAQAQAMQEQLEQAQAALAARTVTGTAGGDLVIEPCRFHLLTVD